MEIKITKKTLIAIGIVIALCAASFCAGRFIRFGRTSGRSEQLIEGIVLAGDTADSVLDRLGISRSAGQSAADLGYAVSRGIEELQRSNEKQRVCLDNIIREVAITQQNAETIKQSFDGISGDIESGFQLAIEQSRSYEAIIRELQSFISDTSKDEQESTAGSGDTQ